MVVATATKALQDQLATKELPFLAAQLGHGPPFSFAVLKGRSNYLCRQRAAEVVGAPPVSATAPAWRGRRRRPLRHRSRWRRPADGGDAVGHRRRTAGPVRRRSEGAGGPAAGLGRLGSADPRPHRLGRHVGHRRPGRTRLRTAPPGVGGRVGDGPRVPGCLPVPVGDDVLRRVGPHPGGDGRRGGGEHPPLRHPCGQRRRRPARPRRRRPRRGPRRGGHHDGRSRASS